MKEKLSKLEFEMFAMRTWATWSERLSLTHKKKERSDGINADWSEILLHDFQHARLALSFTREPTKCNSPKVWVAPPEDKLRLDVDAAYNADSNNYAIGGVVRNHAGQPVLAFGRKIDKPQSITCAELLAIEGGLQIAQLHDLPIHQVTSDSLLAVQAVTRPEENLSYVGSNASDIRTLLESQSNITLNHIRRSANVVAHSIAAFFYFFLVSLRVGDWGFPSLVNSSCNERHINFSIKLQDLTVKIKNKNMDLSRWNSNV
ncbi:uncharacterized protein [Primulina eburnea]|uniref:uncharacterized protein n=1 Tax=Primulina eburnea TaxID=1245227 RepID=UPI003C6CB292